MLGFEKKKKSHFANQMQAQEGRVCLLGHSKVVIAASLSGSGVAPKPQTAISFVSFGLSPASSPRGHYGDRGVLQLSETL